MTRDVKMVVIHCSASDRPGHDNIKTIKSWHVDENKWSDIGYHFVITQDGGVHFGRDVDIIGAHVKGYNAFSLGICLTGLDFFSDEQKEAAVKLCRMLRDKYELNAVDFVAHRELNPTKTCPNFDVQEIRRRLVA